MRLTQPQNPEFQPLVNRMTNWQRNQWARRGYPAGESDIRFCLGLQRNVQEERWRSWHRIPYPRPSRELLETLETLAE